MKYSTQQHSVRPMFFAAADKIMRISIDDKDNCLILRMRSMSAIDATAMHSLEELQSKCSKKNIVLILSHVNEQPMNTMKKAGFFDAVGAENFCDHIDDALARAEQIVGEAKQNCYKKDQEEITVRQKNG